MNETEPKINLELSKSSAVALIVLMDNGVGLFEDQIRTFLSDIEQLELEYKSFIPEPPEIPILKQKVEKLMMVFNASTVLVGALKEELINNKEGIDIREELTKQGASII